MLEFSARKRQTAASFAAAILVVLPFVIVANANASVPQGYLYSYSLRSTTSAASTLTLVSVNTLGNPITGYYTELYDQYGDVLGTSYTPSSYTLDNGVPYQIESDSWGPCTFVDWSGAGLTGSTADPAPITISGPTTLTAIYSGSACGSQTASSTSTSGTSSSSTTTTTTTHTTSSSSSSSTTTKSSTSKATVTTVSSTSSSSSTSQTTTQSSSIDPPATTTTSTSTSTSTSSSSPLGLIVPMYMYPDSYWNTLMAAKEAYPSVPVIAIINPDNGPSTAPDSTYQTYTANLASAGIVIAGYVDTAEMTTPIATAEAEMQDYQAWYPQVSIIFLDDMPDSYSSSFGTYYSTLTAYAHSLGLTTIANPGWEVSSAAYLTTDGTMYYESEGLPSLAYLQAYDYGVPGSHFSFIATSVSSLPSQSYFDSAAQYAAFVYISDQSDSYANLPTYLTQEMAMLAAT